MNNRPNFLGIGAPKCGTTWLSSILMMHSNIFMAHEKEVLYFSDKFSLGENWYLSRFFDADNEKAVGEFSVNYMHKSNVPAKRIFDFNKDMKLIVMLRDPVYRSYSHYRWLKQVGKLNANITFNNALKLNNDILDYSYYFKNLEIFIELFNKEYFFIGQLKI